MTTDPGDRRVTRHREIAKLESGSQRAAVGLPVCGFGVAAVARVTVRLTDLMAEQLDAVAEKRGVPAARLVRQLIAQAVAGEPVNRPDPPTEAELVDLLAEKARQGNVSAIRSRLAREQAQDPRERALALFTGMALERQP
jgi:hypothetical protein